jgi:hypothetical protein
MTKFIITFFTYIFSIVLSLLLIRNNLFRERTLFYNEIKHIYHLLFNYKYLLIILQFLYI